MENLKEEIVESLWSAQRSVKKELSEIHHRDIETGTVWEITSIVTSWLVISDEVLLYEKR